MTGTRLIFAALWLASGAASAQAVPPAASPRPARINDVIVNMRDVDIAQVAEQVSRITGRTLVLDPNVKGVVNVVSAEPLSPDGVWDLFRSVLRTYGFAAVRSGAAWRIVPQASAVQGGATASGLNAVRAADVVTRVIPLRNLPSDGAIRVLKPLVASFGSIEALASPNAVVVTDYAENVRRIERLAQQLDGGGGPSFESMDLRHASAKDVGAALTRMLGDGTAPGSPRIAVDERSNVILVRGDARALAEARRLVALLDKSGGTAPATRVFRLNFADAESITNVLRGLTGQPQSASNPVARSLSRSTSGIGAGSTGTASSQLQSGLSGAFSGQNNNFGSLGGVGGLNGGGPVFGGSGFGGTAAPNGNATIGSPGGGTAPGSGVQTDDLSIQAAPELNAVVVRASPAALATIAGLIEQLDVRRPQVLIEAAIAEVTSDVAEQLGVQFGTGQAAVFGGVTGGTSFNNSGVSLGSIIQTLLPIGTAGAGAGAVLGNGLSIAGGSAGNFSVLVQALGTSAKANLLSTPSVTTLDNEPAEIVVGQNVPFRTGSFESGGTTLTPFTTIERQDVGITLRVVPRIHEGDSIRLEVSQEVSSLVPAVTGAADLITNRRSIQTTVLADNGDTIVLGGLISDDRTSSRSQIPLLGDIPVLGNLFKSRQTEQVKRTLFVFLRPTILRDRASIVAAADTKYARLRAQEAGDPDRSLLLHSPAPRLPLEIEGLY